MQIELMEASPTLAHLFVSRGRVAPAAIPSPAGQGAGVGGRLAQHGTLAGRALGVIVRVAAAVVVVAAAAIIVVKQLIVRLGTPALRGWRSGRIGRRRQHCRP